MIDDNKPIPPEEMETIVKNVPVVSVDLLIHHGGGLVFGKRTHEPAKGEWFVPGGTVLKGETLVQAAHRVAREEIGTDVVVEKKLGTYEHFYEAAAINGVDKKQYLATAFVVTPINNSLSTEEQHTEFRIFNSPFPNLHDYIVRYINDLNAAGYQY